jgi:predicted O-methyltransferase YrrM
MLDRTKLLRALPVIERPLAWLEEHPTLHGLVHAALGLRRPIFVDYRVRPVARYGYGRPELLEIRAMLEANRSHFAERLKRFGELFDQLATIPLRGAKDGTTPCWDNGWLPALDALALYGLLAELEPARYVEVGSGNSTRFARRAITDHALRTHVTSIDPAPRAQVDALCDKVIRGRLEDCDPAVFAGLDAGDVVFLDGSHRVFTGSDVTVFFFEILPLLRPGVLVHIHDIMLPRDYPPSWRYRYYSEQYLLAAFLMANPARFEVELPTAFIDGDDELRDLVEPLWRRIGLVEKYLPASFWLRVR